ncbi:hypothetical protein B9Z55_001234 [Caenorhabditis nigoni]|uniref:Uncharacterized protein n=1 Tax=Caenorhabditis nigoni TaxID=1611254 RepID=A0A2G5VEQ3_9PELO|nr:hypothetical protein B9Z55_001234 [Caenorhabditis nigoni]
MSASQNDESKNLTDTLDEILKLQEELQTRIGSSNHNLETNFENIKDFVSRDIQESPICCSSDVSLFLTIYASLGS